MVRLFGKQVSKEQRDELLSAYLDGQLGADEHARLEARLATDPALQVELEALRRTVALVRELPQVPVPCNFILPRTAAARPRPARPARPRLAWAAPFLTAATAATSLLFVLTLASNLLVTGYRAFAPAAAPLPEAEAPQLAMEAPPEDQEGATEEAEMEYGAPTEAPPALAPRSPATETPAEEPSRAEVEGEGYDETPTEAPLPPQSAPGEDEAPLIAPTTTMTAEEWVGMSTGAPDEATEAPPPAEAGGGPAEATEEPTTAPATLPPTVAPKEAGESNAAPTPGEVAELTADGTDKGETGEDRQAALEGREARPPQIALWLVLEVALGLTTLALAFATVLAWRARHH